MFDDAISGLPDVFRADVSLPNPSSLAPRALALDTTDPAGSDALAGPDGPEASVGTPGRGVPAVRTADEPWVDSGGASADREPTTLCSDGGYDPDGDATPERGRVYDAGLVVRLEADGVLFHEGDGRTTGRWIAADRAAVVSLGEVD